MTDIDRPGERLATVTTFPGSFDPTDTEVDDNPESASELAKRAENISLYALTRRAVSIREMEKLLKSRDLPDEVVATEIARLEGVNLLNDYDLATDLAERFQRRKGLGASSVKAELGKRLIASAAIDAAIAELPGDQLELATEEARKRLSRLKGLDKETLNRRLYAYLARRGFRGPEISNAIKLEESQQEKRDRENTKEREEDTSTETNAPERSGSNKKEEAHELCEANDTIQVFCLVFMPLFTCRIHRSYSRSAPLDSACTVRKRETWQHCPGTCLCASIADVRKQLQRTCRLHRQGGD